MSVNDIAIKTILDSQPDQIDDQVYYTYQDDLPDSLVKALVAGDPDYAEEISEYVGEARDIAFGGLAEELVKDYVSENPEVEDDDDWDEWEVRDEVRIALSQRDIQDHLMELAGNTTSAFIGSMVVGEGEVDEETEEDVAARLIELVGLPSSEMEKMVELIGNVPSHVYCAIVVGEVPVDDLLTARRENKSQAVFGPVELVVGNPFTAAYWSDTFAGEVTVSMDDLVYDPYDINDCYGGYQVDGGVEVTFQ